MKNRLIVLLCLFSLLTNPIIEYSSLKTKAEEKQDFKVIGYFSESPFDKPIDESIQFEGLTHIIYAFLKPKDDGTFYNINKPERLKELVKKSHENNVKVIIAIGGVFYQKEPLVTKFESLASSEEGINNFVNGVLAFVNEYNLDGVEIDWEYPNNKSSTNYEKLILAIDKALTKEGKTLSAALAGAGSINTTAESVASITKKSLECFDWINIMAYDLPTGHHSPYWFADVSIKYWLGRGVPKEKIVLGIPLYARPSWKQYRDIVALDKENAYIDFIKGEKLDSYYNGLNTVCEKTRLSLNKAGGIMFFDINEDTHDETSAQRAALDMINRYEKYKLSDVFIVVNNKELRFSSEDNMGIPYIDKQNRIQIPLRKALEAIGASISYDATNRLVTAQKDDIIIKVIIGENTINVNGKNIIMDTKAELKDGRTYLPIRWVYENFGYKITWNEGSKSVFVNK